MTSNISRLFVMVLCCAWGPWAHAGRPLIADDAGTAETGECQVEVWGETAKEEKAYVVAPACGIAPGLEIGVDNTKFSPSDVVGGSAGLADKSAPEFWSL